MAFEDQLLEVPERRGNFFLGQTLKSLARFCRAIMGLVGPWEVGKGWHPMPKAPSPWR